MVVGDDEKAVVGIGAAETEVAPIVLVALVVPAVLVVVHDRGQRERR